MRTLRQKLLATFFLLTSITVGVILLFFNFDDKKNETNHQVEILNTTHQLILKDFIVFEDFLSYETINPLFFELEQSIYLMKHEELLSRIHHNFDSVAASGKVLSKVFNQIDSISAALDSYEKYTHEMVALVKLRGFKDYGLEGKMREEIHALERYKELNQIAVLTLRRHEKDFLLRGQQNYASEHKELVRNFTNEILAQNIPKERKELILNKLNNYSRYFQQIVILDQKIGLKHNDGLKFLTRSRITEIQFLMEDLTKQVSQIRHSRLSAWKYLYITIALLLVGVSLFIAFFLSKRISIKLSYLSQHMAEFVGSDFTSTTSVDTDNEEDEISQLLRNYQVLHSKSSRLISDFRVMVHEATAEVVLQKERIEKQHAEISLNHSELIEKNVLIEHQKTELEETNKDILDSIRYAQKIQFAILPDADTMHEMFAQHFVLNLPRDIIGGDFFWARQLRSTNYDLSVVAVADCTGHGVPGALMSMLGFAFLNEIVLRQKVFQAAQVLDMLREKVMTALRRNDERRSAGDGMDIALCIIDRRCHTLSFAGANRPLYLIRDGEINAISGNNFAIGKMTGISKRFTQTDISLRQNDSIYLFSDGFADQFGGDDGRKFMRKGLKNTLSQIQHQPMAQQGASLQSVHDNWRGPFRQVDDILVVGIKYDITEKHT